jgi:hypothetical protein
VRGLRLAHVRQRRQVFRVVANTRLSTSVGGEHSREPEHGSAAALQYRNASPTVCTERTLHDTLQGPQKKYRTSLVTKKSVGDPPYNRHRTGHTLYCHSHCRSDYAPIGHRYTLYCHSHCRSDYALIGYWYTLSLTAFRMLTAEKQPPHNKCTSY